MWDRGTPISNVKIQCDGLVDGKLVMEPGETISLTAEQASDSDHWQINDGEGTDEDELQYSWSSVGSAFSTANGQSTTWTAPALFAGVPRAEYKLILMVDDTPKAIPDTEFGNRDDLAGYTSITVAVQHNLNWDAQPAPVGQVVTEGQTIKAGKRLKLRVVGYDYDTATDSQGNTATYLDRSLAFTWTPDAGRMVDANTWLAPSANEIPPTGLDVTIGCKMDDFGGGPQTGVMAPDTGTRNDNQVTLPSITIHVAAQPCGQWIHQSWTEATEIVWSENGVPQIPTATEHLIWVDECDANDVKPPRDVTRPYKLIKDIIVTDSDGTQYREVTFQAFSSHDGQPTALLTGRHAFKKVWVPGEGITGGQIASPLATPGQDIVVKAGETLSLAVTQATDNDAWTRGTQTQIESDQVTYSWTKTGAGTFNGNTTGPEISWQAPAETDVPEGSEGVTVTFTCTLDDVWQGTETGVPATDEGTRNDDTAVERTVSVRVLRNPCGRWVHQSWQPGSISWTTDALGDPMPIAPADAIETVHWDDPCSGTTKPNETRKVPYTLLKDEAVQIGGVWYHQVQYRAFSTCPGGDSTPEATDSPLTDQRILPKHWSIPDDLDGGQMTTSLTNVGSLANPPATAPGESFDLTLPQGASAAFNITGAKDNDTYSYWHVPEALAADTIRYKWMANRLDTMGVPSFLGFSDSATFSTNQVGLYLITCEVDDASLNQDSGVMAPDLGNRNDAAVVYSVIIQVDYAKTWDAGDAITASIASPEANQIIHEGESLTCTVNDAVDSDHWQKGPEEGTENDTLTYVWSGEGVFADAHAASTSWTAPTLSATVPEATYTLTCTIDDTPKTIPSDEGGNRGDTAITRTIQVRVVQKFWDKGTAISGAAAITSPGVTGVPIIDQGAGITVTMAEGHDSDHWVDGDDEGTEDDDITYHWTATGGNFANANVASTTWTAPSTLPNGNEAAVTYTLTCTVDDAPKAIVSPAAGTRDDTSVQKTFVVKVARKIWDKGSAIQGGDSIDSSGQNITRVEDIVYVHQGGSVALTMEAATDSDHWVYRNTEGVEDDEVTYSWEASNNAGDLNVTNNQVVTFTAPQVLPEGVAYTSTKLTCTVDDKPKAIISPDGGARDDTSKKASIVVIITRKVWGASPEIGHHPALDDEGHVESPVIWVPDGILTAPLTNTVVGPGATIGCSVEEAHDYDSWTEGEAGDIAEDSPITYSWTASIGQFQIGTNTDGSPMLSNSASGRTATWIAPVDLSDNIAVHITCTLDDQPEDRVNGPQEEGSHDDDAIERTTTIYIKRPSWSAEPRIGHHHQPPPPDVQGPGALVDDGRMISPQNQQGGFDSHEELLILSGSSVPCEVEEATDLDTLTSPQGTVSEHSDEVNYTWHSARMGDSGSNGTWEWQELENGQLVTKTGNSAPTRKANWLAPNDVTSLSKFTLSCTLDDKPLSKGAHEIGSRDDASIERSVRVKGPTSSIAALSLDVLHKVQEASEVEPDKYESFDNAPIGGDVYAALNLTLAEGVTVSSQKALVRLREMPDNDNGVTHAESENHIDVEVKFDDEIHWQRYWDPDGNGPKKWGWWDALEAPSAAPTENSEVRYRYLLPWKTTEETTATRYDGGQTVSGKLWGHNGAHQISLWAVDNDLDAQVVLTTPDVGGSYNAATPEPRDCTVSNLVITDVATSNGTSDYIKLDPDADEDSDLKNPVVSFTIQDHGDFEGHAYRWRVTLRSTDNEDQITNVTYEGIVSEGMEDGSVRVNVPINKATLAADGITQAALNEWGTYNFHISIREYKSRVDAEDDLEQSRQDHEARYNRKIDDFTLRSEKLSIPYRMPAPNADKAGHSGRMEESGDETTVDWFLTHYFKDTDWEGQNHNLTAKIDVLTPYLALDTNASKSLVYALNTPYFDRLLHQFPSEHFVFKRDYIAVTTALDDHKTQYRDHHNHAMLAKNARNAEGLFDADLPFDNRVCAGGHYIEGGAHYWRLDNTHTLTLTGKITKGAAANDHLYYNCPIRLELSAVSKVEFGPFSPTTPPIGADGARLFAAGVIPGNTDLGTVLGNDQNYKTDGTGSFSFQIVSGRTPQKIYVSVQIWDDSKWKDIAELRVNCDMPVTKRLFGIKEFNQDYDSDTGWQFDPPVFDTPEGDGIPNENPKVITCRLFLRFLKDNSGNIIDKRYFLRTVGTGTSPVESMDEGNPGDGIISDAEYANHTSRGSGASPLVMSNEATPRLIWLPVAGHKLKISFVLKGRDVNTDGDIMIPGLTPPVQPVQPTAPPGAPPPPLVPNYTPTALSTAMASFCAPNGKWLAVDAAGNIQLAANGSFVTTETRPVNLPLFLPVTTDSDGIAEFHIRAGYLIHRITQIEFSVEDLSVQ